MAVKERNIAVLEIEPRYTNVLLINRKVEVKTVEGEYLPAGLIPPTVKKVYITSSFLDPVYGLNLFPPARGKAFESLIRKAAAKMMGPKAYESRHQLVQKEGEQNLVLVVGIPRSDLEWLGARLRGLGISPWVLLPSAISLSLILQRLGYLQKAIPTVYLEMKHGEAHCIIYRGPAPAVVRKIHFASPAPGLVEMEVWGTLAREILQTLLYYRQRFHGEEISRLVVGGEKPSDDVLAYLRTGLGIPVEPLVAAGDLPLPAEFVLKYPTLSGSLLATPAHPLAFVIPSIEEERRLRWQRLTTWTTLGAALFLSVFLMNYLVLTHRQIKERTGMLEKQQVFLLEQKALLSEQVYQLTLAEAYSKLQEQLIGNQPDWQNFLKELQALAPERVRFERFTVQFEQGKWTGKLEGSARHPQLAQAYHLTSLVENRFALSPYVQSPLMERQKATFLKEGIVALPFRITFTITSFRRGEG